MDRAEEVAPAMGAGRLTTNVMPAEAGTQSTVPKRCGLRLMREMRAAAKKYRCRLSPHPWAHATMRGSQPATGRGWAHSPSHVAATGARKESGWLEVREARRATVAGQRQQWRDAGDRLE